MNKMRNSNIEILRIISIVMIVMSHYCVHGIGKNVISNMNLGFNRFILETSMLGNIGSILFVLISGYYLSNSSKVKYKKMIHLIFQIFFYSFFIYLILYFIGLNPFSFKSLTKAALPITFKEYWFASVYILLYLFHPYINKLLKSLGRKEHFVFITIMFALFSIMTTLTNSDFYGNELIQFIMFYCIGSYLYMYPDNILGRNNNNYKILFISTFLIILSILTFDMLGTKINVFNTRSTYFMSRTSPLAIMFSVALFDIFSRKKVFENKFINTIGSLIFGVYLISDNKYLRILLWKDIYQNSKYINEPYLIFHLIFAILITIIVCLIIEFIRKYAIENLIFKKLDKVIDNTQIRIENKFDKSINDKINKKDLKTKNKD